MEGITYPVAVKDVPKFEKQNDIFVNVFGYKNGYYPLYISKDQMERHVNLLLLEDKGKTHYCLIKNLNGMLYSQTKHKAQQYFCTYCLHGFTREDLLIAHKQLCETHCFVTVVGSFQFKLLSVRQGTQHFTDENKASRK